MPINKPLEFPTAEQVARMPTPFDVTDADTLEWFNDLVRHAGAHQHERRFVERIREILKHPALTWELSDTLRAFHDEQEDYSFINNLGGYDNHNMRRARAVLTKMGVAFAPDRSKGPARTKEVDVWQVEYVQRIMGNWVPQANREPTEDKARRLRDSFAGDSRMACVIVTGPHKQTVPAD